MNIVKRFYLFLLFHQRKYDKVLQLTNFKITKDVNKINNLSLRYQGLCSFYKENFYHSKMCFEILLEKNAATSKDCNMLSYIYSRHNEKEKVILTLCKALEINKNDKKAKKALEHIRLNAGEINFSEDEYFEKIILKQPFLIPFFLILKILIVLIILSIIVYFSFSGIKKFIANIKLSKTKVELDKVILPDYNPNLLVKPKEENISYSFSEKEIKDKFEKIKLDVIENKAVEAQILINQIRLSNASASVKAKMDILEGFILEPDYALFKNVVSFTNFIKEKPVYDNIYILWDGRVVNYFVTKEQIKFNLVIGDEKNGTIEAVIPVKFNKAVILENNEVIKVFGKIKLEKDNFYIEGKFAIKQKK